MDNIYVSDFFTPLIRHDSDGIHIKNELIAKLDEIKEIIEGLKDQIDYFQKKIIILEKGKKYYENKLLKCKKNKCLCSNRVNISWSSISKILPHTDNYTISKYYIGGKKTKLIKELKRYMLKDVSNIILQYLTHSIVFNFKDDEKYEKQYILEINPEVSNSLLVERLGSKWTFRIRETKCGKKRRIICAYIRDYIFKMDLHVHSQDNDIHDHDIIIDQDSFKLKHVELTKLNSFCKFIGRKKLRSLALELKCSDIAELFNDVFCIYNKMKNRQKTKK